MKVNWKWVGCMGYEGERRNHASIEGHSHACHLHVAAAGWRPEWRCLLDGVLPSGHGTVLFDERESERERERGGVRHDL